jgi:hypothetical protein
MTPIAHFDAVWQRCSQLKVLHTHLASVTTNVLQPDELLRAEWVARVGALDLYVHEKVIQSMTEIFEGRRPPSPSYLRFQLSNETLDRVRGATSKTDALAAFDLELRGQLGRRTFQFPEDIAEAIRLCSTVELWNEVALRLGASPATKNESAKDLKKDLSLIIHRRNKIAHEGDLQPSLLREPWPITKADLDFVATQIETLVRAIDGIF